MMRLFTIDNLEDSILLRTESRDVSREMWQSEDFRILTKRMLTTVQNPENTGVGIAAPQVYHKRLNLVPKDVSQYPATEERCPELQK